MAAQKFGQIFIIYNPNSTGDSHKLAKELQRKLAKSKRKAELIGTKRAGHARELAYELAKKYKNPLIISSSGDGGYHEVVIGVMKAKDEGYSAMAAVLPAGNANDHARVTHIKPLDEAINAQSITQIDLLKIYRKCDDEEESVMYAHSYAGIGLSAIVATELNNHDLNAVKEKWLVLRKMYAYRPFKILHNGEVLKFDSLVFANISEMAKVLTLSKSSRIDDGKFELISFPYQQKRVLWKKIIKMTITGLEPKSIKSYDFKTLKKTLMQVDGEIIELEPNCQIKIESAHRALTTIF